jgi:hypothetical protein
MENISFDSLMENKESQRTRIVGRFIRQMKSEGVFVLGIVHVSMSRGRSDFIPKMSPRIYKSVLSFILK